MKTSLLLPAIAMATMFWAATPSLHAQETVAAPASAAKPESKLVGEFAGFAGSRENSLALVSGLRSGSSITLVPAEGQGGTTTTFSSPTKPMGYGNTRIALSLAEARLAADGVSNPTTQQIQGALVGSAGSDGSQPGILQMRADGMGWGQIANSMGFKLGEVMSGRQGAVAPASAANGAGGTKTTAIGADGAAAGRGKGVTTAGGAPAGKGNGVTTASGGAGAAGGKSSGVTTAAGGSAGGVTTGQGVGNAYGRAPAGTVNAAGNTPGAGAAGGQGKGGGKP